MRPPNMQNQYKIKNTTMKKTYISPSMEVIKVQVANVMAASMAIDNGTSVDSDIMLGRDIASGSSAPEVWNEWK